MEQITFAPTFTAWQRTARRALQIGVEPGVIHWQEHDDAQLALGMFDAKEEEPVRSMPLTEYRVPREFVDAARQVACHHDPQRWALLYRTLFRLIRGEAHLLNIAADPDSRII